MVTGIEGTNLEAALKARSYGSLSVRGSRNTWDGPVKSFSCHNQAVLEHDIPAVEVKAKLQEQIDYCRSAIEDAKRQAEETRTTAPGYSEDMLLGRIPHLQKELDRLEKQRDSVEDVRKI